MKIISIFTLNFIPNFISYEWNCMLKSPLLNNPPTSTKKTNVQLQNCSLKLFPHLSENKNGFFFDLVNIYVGSIDFEEILIAKTERRAGEEEVILNCNINRNCNRRVNIFHSLDHFKRINKIFNILWYRSIGGPLIIHSIHRYQTHPVEPAVTSQSVYSTCIMCLKIFVDFFFIFFQL